jgi:poly(A) polymerase
VRDLLLGRRPTDLDLLAKDPEKAAQEAAFRLSGRLFPLDEERRLYRVVTPRRLTLDFAPLEDLEEDLLSRDFRLNALALSGRLVLGPFGAREDLKGRRLEPVREENLYQDHLRSLRGVRLSTTLGLGLGPGARAALARHARHLQAHPEDRPAPERVGSELERLLLSPRAAHGFLLMDRLGLLEVYLPELARTRGVPQLGRHFLDVLDHSLSVLFHLLWLYPQAPLALRLAALLHDLGKATTGVWDEEKGRYRFLGHEKESARLAEVLLLRLRFPKKVVERVKALVLAHMHAPPSTPRGLRRFFLRRSDLLPDLLYLQAADRLARLEGEREAWALLELAEAFRTAPPPSRPLLSGEEVMALLGLSPGPEVGRALRRLLLAQAEGRVTSKEEARAFLIPPHPGLRQDGGPGKALPKPSDETPDAKKL